MQFALHHEQFLALGAEHTAHGDTRPARHHLGNILGRDLLLNHRLTGRSLAVFGLEVRNLSLGLDHLAVANLRHAPKIALSLGLLGLHLQQLDLLLQALNLLQQVALMLPLGTHRPLARFQLVNLLGQKLDALLVLLATNRLALDFELTHATVERINLLGYGVHLKTQARGSLIDQINRLVGQKARGNVAGRKLHGRHNRLILNADAVMVFVSLLQSAQNRDGIFNRRFLDHHLLEATLQGLVLLEIFLELIEGRGTDGAQLATCQGGLQDVGGIHRARRLTGSDERMNLVDEEQNLPLGGNHLLHHGLQSLLKLALILRTRNERTHIKRINRLRADIFRHIPVDDTAGYSLGNGRLTDTRLTHQDGVVLRATRENLQDATNLLITPDNGVEFALSCLLIEVDGILAERIPLLRGSRGIDRRTLAEGADSLHQLLLARTLAFEQFGSRTTLCDKGQQEVFDRGIFIAKRLRKIDRTLNRAREVGRKIGFATRHLRQMLQGLRNLLLKAL